MVYYRGDDDDADDGGALQGNPATCTHGRIPGRRDEPPAGSGRWAALSRIESFFFFANAQETGALYYAPWVIGRAIYRSVLCTGQGSKVTDPTRHHNLTRCIWHRFLFRQHQEQGWKVLFFLNDPNGVFVVNADWISMGTWETTWVDLCSFSDVHYTFFEFATMASAILVLLTMQHPTASQLGHVLRVIKSSARTNQYSRHVRSDDISWHLVLSMSHDGLPSIPTCNSQLTDAPGLFWHDKMMCVMHLLTLIVHINVIDTAHDDMSTLQFCIDLLVQQEKGLAFIIQTSAPFKVISSNEFQPSSKERRTTYMPIRSLFHLTIPLTSKRRSAPDPFNEGSLEIRDDEF